MRNFLIQFILLFYTIAVSGKRGPNLLEKLFITSTVEPSEADCHNSFAMPIVPLVCPQMGNEPKIPTIEPSPSATVTIKKSGSIGIQYINYPNVDTSMENSNRKSISTDLTQQINWPPSFAPLFQIPQPAETHTTTTPFPTTAITTNPFYGNHPIPFLLLPYSRNAFTASPVETTTTTVVPPLQSRYDLNKLSYPFLFPFIPLKASTTTTSSPPTTAVPSFNCHSMMYSWNEVECQQQRYQQQQIFQNLQRNCPFPYASNYAWCTEQIVRTTKALTTTITTTEEPQSFLVPWLPFHLIPAAPELLFTTTTTTATPPESNKIPLIQIFPFIAPYLIETTTSLPTTYIELNKSSSQFSSIPTTTLTTPTALLSSTILPSTTTIKTTANTTTVTEEISSSTTTIATTTSDSLKNLTIEINLENMYCFSVNPSCSSTMHQWSRMISKSNVTRWTKRYWSTTPVTTMKTTYKPRKTTKKTASNGTTEFYYDYSELNEVINYFGQCNATVFNDEDRLTLNILLYTSSGWIVFWVLLTVIINFVFLEFGAHRFLDFYQELGFAIIYIFMGVFVLRAENKSFCTATTMILLFFLVFILSVAFMQTFWLSSIMKGSSVINGRLPVLVNYIWPIMISTIVTIGSYFAQRNEFASTKVHCFCAIFSSLYWTFVISAWTLWFIILIRNQLSITACRQSRPTADPEQLYWSKKSCKGIPILCSWFLMSFFTLMFAIDMQIFWLGITYAVLTFIFGPILFYLHTQNYIKTNNGLSKKTHLSLYRVCPPKRPKLLAQPTTNADTELNKSVPTRNSEPAPPPPPPPSIIINPSPNEIHDSPPPAPIILPSTVQPVSSITPNTSSADLLAPPAPINTGPASAQQFYDWLMDRNEKNMHESEKILFRPIRPT